MAPGRALLRVSMLMVMTASLLSLIASPSQATHCGIYTANRSAVAWQEQYVPSWEGVTDEIHTGAYGADEAIIRSTYAWHDVFEWLEVGWDQGPRFEHTNPEVSSRGRRRAFTTTSPMAP